MTPDEPVLVVGAGIAGLTAALSFAEAGFQVEILERAERLEEAGAGLQLSPNALRVIARLGVMERLNATGVAAEVVTLRSGRTGRPIARIPVTSGDGTAYLSLRRSDLQSALLACVGQHPAIALTLGAELLRVDAINDEMHLAFRHAGADGRTSRRRARIVIAADGVRSAAAHSLGHAEPTFSGDIAFRLTVRDAAARGLSVPTGIESWLGAFRHAVAYPVRSGLDVNLVLIAPRPSTHEGRPATVETAALRDEFHGWDERLTGFVSAAGPATAWPLFVCDRRRRPTDPSGLVLVGDAAHALLPYAAQGAAMAIEDGYVAASVFRQEPTPREAVARFEQERRPRLDSVRRRVAFHRFVYHLPMPFSLGRDLTLSLRRPAALARDLGWLYDWKPPEL